MQADDPRVRHRDWMVLHGALIVFLGLVFGIPFGSAIVNGWGEEAVRAWKLAHLEGLMNGMLVLVLGLALPRLGLGGRKPALLAWSMIVAGYGNTVGGAVGAIAGVRGLEPEGPAMNAFVFACFMVGMWGALVAVALAIWGAWATLRS